MAATKTSKNKKKLTRKKSATKASPEQRPTYAELRQQLAERTQQLNEALDQQIATNEVLGIIGSSPETLESVLSAIAERAARLCHAENATIVRVEGNVFQRA